MAELKAGTRMKSAVCATEVMVIAAPAGSLDITCGGAAMVGSAEEAGGGSVDAAFAEGTLLGKRYVNQAGDLELLCVKPGDGSLALDGETLVLKEAKALPSSD
ncbi:hypothetical protein [Pseudohalioglobus lutimaris]|uniref:Uncharacterized protein n=1 Tax=Pseudohalioglobus lutimaris TaxID=1737061 RepID=A0A2N5X3V8_9GAMM|nr:hypothetical protein [Pseudohalioglobus lutimaris]PLW69186.1 hypothetical protein C0039_08985 [Pseudohalioglobus lutimaris]